MNENEIMEMEEVTEEQPEVVEVEERSGIGPGVAMLIGAGLALAGARVAKFAKKKYDEHKAKKEASKKAMEDGEMPDAVEDSEEVEDSEN